jgi:photosystem II stability/assembly factor-like uncharacterized protein
MKSFLTCLFVVLSFVVGYGQSLDSLLKPAKYRNIGPFRGGRANGGSGVVGDPLTYYMGTTGGGLWKTSDAGHHWKNVSDGFFKSSSVGAVSVSESSPNTVYVGMGEHAPRGVMTSHGDGVYKSTDAGKTWKHMGLKETLHISRIVIHPSNPDIVWVAAQGALHGKTQERGVYKSTDGGKTWKKTLYVNDMTGASELSIDMHNPKVLYAAMWEHMRTPWQVISGGPGSGLYKSTDGGETWSKIHKGLPKELGKMGIAVSRANSNLVYAIIESDSEKEKGGLFVSKDAGMSWSRVSGDHRLIQRAWYYIEVTPDPNNENTVYVMSADWYRSIDGGKTWEEISTAHGDYHDLWINPDNSKNMLITGDGGSEVTFDGGKNFSRLDNMPTAQFYRVATDNLFPYNVYGGQQDNTSVKIASIGIGSSGIDESHWSASAGGESAFLAFDPDAPEKVMGGSYLGTIELLDVKSTSGTQVMIEPNLYLGLAARDMKYLYNWNAPIIKSQHEPNTYYHGAQYLLRTRDEGITWEEISPDLTYNDDSKQGKGGAPYTNEAVGAENYGTLSYVIESPHEAGVIYTGSDDGKVFITKDNGENWKDVTPKAIGETLVNAIDISPHDPGTVYIATTRYKFNDQTPSLWKSTNYGKSWKNITGNLPADEYTRVVREDTERKDLLFAGTFRGVYVSFNGGGTWSALKSNLPVTPITDLTVKDSDLVVATMGRSFWIYDDLGLLRQWDSKPNEAKLFSPEPAILANWWDGMNSNSSTGMGDFKGVNPATGMVIYYNLPEVKKGSVLTLEIRDAQGKLVNSYSSKKDSTYVKYEGAPSKKDVLPAKKGLNRFVWNMRHDMLLGAPEVYIEGSFRGHKAIPGTYSLKLSSGDKVLETTAEIKNNPMYEISQEEFMAYDEFMGKAEKSYNEMTRMTNQLHEIQQKLTKVVGQLNAPGQAELKSDAQTLLKELKTFDAAMVQRLSKAYDDVENFENGFTAHYLTAINQTDSSIPKVTNGARNKMKELNATWAGHKKTGEELLNNKIPAMNKKLFDSGFGALFATK